MQSICYDVGLWTLILAIAYGVLLALALVEGEFVAAGSLAAQQRIECR
jgi:hypothetical protein